MPNLTREAGLIRVSQLSRGQLVQLLESNRRYILIYKVRDPKSDDLSTSNAKLETVLQHAGDRFQVPLIMGNYRSVEVVLGQLEIRQSFKVVTSQHVEGTISLSILFHVTSPQVVVGADVVMLMKEEMQRVILRYTQVHTHQQIREAEIEQLAQRANTAHAGIKVDRVIAPELISWPSNIVKDIRDVVSVESESLRSKTSARIRLEEERHRNDLILSELTRFGILDPEIILYVLSHYGEKGHENIMLTVEKAREKQRTLSREERDEARGLLNEMIKGGMVDREQIDVLVMGTIQGATHARPTSPYSLPYAPGVDYSSLPSVGSAPQGQLPPSQSQHQPPPSGSFYKSNDGQTIVPPAIGSLPPTTNPVPYSTQKYAPGRGVLLVQQTGARLNLSADVTRIGRHSEKNQIVIQEPSVSKEHAIIWDRGSYFSIYNVNPQNVTYLNGNPVPNDSEVSISEGDVIRIGSYSFQLTLQPQNTTHWGTDEDKTRLG